MSETKIIELTKKQVEQLDELQKHVEQEYEEKNQRSMLIAQVFPNCRAFVVGFLPIEISARIQRLTNPKGYNASIQLDEIPADLARAIDASEAVFNAILGRPLDVLSEALKGGEE